MINHTERHKISKEIFIEILALAGKDKNIGTLYEKYRRKVARAYNNKLHVNKQVPAIPETCPSCGRSPFSVYMPEYYAENIISGCPHCHKSFVS